MLELSAATGEIDLKYLDESGIDSVKARGQRGNYSTQRVRFNSN